VACAREARSWAKAEGAGRKVSEVCRRGQQADVVMMLLPDEQIAAVYKTDSNRTSAGCVACVAHGFHVHYGQGVPRGGRRSRLCDGSPRRPRHTVLRAPTRRSASCRT